MKANDSAKNMATMERFTTVLVTKVTAVSAASPSRWSASRRSTVWVIDQRLSSGRSRPSSATRTTHSGSARYASRMKPSGPAGARIKAKRVHSSECNA